MIQRMQRRLTVVLLLFLVSVYIGLCSTSYFAGMRSIQEDSAVIFDRIMEPIPPEDGIHRMPGQVGIPYFMIFLDPNGTLIDAAQGQFDLTTEELEDITQKALALRQENGYLKEYSLRFHLRATPIGYQLMFTDESVREETQRRQIHSSLILGLILLPVFYLFSRSVSAFIVRPVKRAWDQQTQFIADASHELKTPLTVILSNTDMILADCSADENDLHRRADYIRKEAERMRALVLELLHLARNDAAPAKCEATTRIDISAAVETSALSFDAVAYENGLAVDTQVEEGIFVYGEEKQLSQLFHILLDNAVKYSLPGGMIRVKLSTERGKYALLIVENQSEALTTEQLSKLFDRFYRVDEARTLQPGYGLGLSVAKQITDQLKGRIWAEHHNGTTSFYVKLKLSKK